MSNLPTKLPTTWTPFKVQKKQVFIPNQIALNLKKILKAFIYKDVTMRPIRSSWNEHHAPLPGWLANGLESMKSPRVTPCPKLGRYRENCLSLGVRAPVNVLRMLMLRQTLLVPSAHRTRSISLAVFTTANDSRRLQSQKWISLAVAINRSWAVGWKAREAMALLLSVNQLSLPPCEWTNPRHSQVTSCQRTKLTSTKGSRWGKMTTCRAYFKYVFWKPDTKSVIWQCHQIY